MEHLTLNAIPHRSKVVATLEYYGTEFDHLWSILRAPSGVSAQRYALAEEQMEAVKAQMKFLLSRILNKDYIDDRDSGS
ncbi:MULTISPECIES: hypothetical protein [Rhizobium]|uniref:hypothetical protein n=1 Tax=Rhizobium TaxID=379 RepID=UPI001A8EAA49|nr:MULTISPECIES: hypothetical protein [Rhizobium]MBN9981868.1 hypothetical protein [Rhizobium laguerreae]MBY5660702.1 hypothetical protein [Rhizobium leguminosarum]MBY5674737.1 hypothetical protein [Rhizobium leguminosarum]